MAKSLNHKIEFFVLIVIILVVAVNMAPTSFVVQTELHVQNINTEVSASRVFYLRSINSSEVGIISFSVAGKVVGNGTVSIYLDDALVYTNVKKAPNFGLITGLPVVTTHVSGSTTPSGKALLALEEGEAVEYEAPEQSGVSQSGIFSDSCMESCSFTSEPKTAYKLTVYVEPGTELLLGRIRYLTP